MRDVLPLYDVEELTLEEAVRIIASEDGIQLPDDDYVVEARQAKDAA